MVLCLPTYDLRWLVFDVTNLAMRSFSFSLTGKDVVIKPPFGGGAVYSVAPAVVAEYIERIYQGV